MLGLVMQMGVLSAYLLLADRATLTALIRAWRPSLLAGLMGAFASRMWFLAFALETAAKVRTLALVEILFAQLVARICSTRAWPLARRWASLSSSPASYCC